MKQCSICGGMKVSNENFARCYPCNQKYKNLSNIIEEQRSDIDDLTKTVSDLMDIIIESKFLINSKKIDLELKF